MNLLKFSEHLKYYICTKLAFCYKSVSSYCVNYNATGMSIPNKVKSRWTFSDVVSCKLQKHWILHLPQCNLITFLHTALHHIIRDRVLVLNDSIKPQITSNTNVIKLSEWFRLGS